MHTPSGVHSPTQCLVCGSPLRFGTQGGLCGSVACAWQMQSAPAGQKCRVCTRPLTIAQQASGVCERMPCRDEWLVQRPLRALHAAHLARIELARKRRDRAAAAKRVPREERESYRLVVLPRNFSRVSKLSPARRRAFEKNLRAALAVARERVAAGETDTDSFIPRDPLTRSEETRAAETQLLGIGCASCRGYCCRQGEDHAFLRWYALKTQIIRHPDDDDESIVARYLSYLGTHAITGGCVYQSATGCTLPRDMRAGICNRFFCDGQRALLQRFTDDDPVRAYIVHQAGRMIYGGTLVEITRAGSRSDRP